MSTQRAATLALFMLLTAGAAQAQAAGGFSDTLTIAKIDSASSMHVRLVNTGAHVSFVGLPSQLVADTMDITAPMQIILPHKAYSLFVASADGATVTMLHDMNTPTGRARFRTTFYSPITLARKNADSPLMVSGAQAGMKTEVLR